MLSELNFAGIKHCPYSLEQVTIRVLHYIVHFKVYHFQCVHLEEGFETY